MRKSKHSYERQSRHPGGMHGSPHETGKHHGGEQRGADELTIGMGPGRAAMRTRSSEDPGVEGAAKGHKATKAYNRGQEPDDD